MESNQEKKDTEQNCDNESSINVKDVEVEDKCDVEIVGKEEQEDEVKNKISNEQITEGYPRSCLKAIFWRFIALGTTMTISYILLGDISTASKIGFADMVIKFIIHYIYERIWSKIKWGYKKVGIENIT